MMHARPSRWMIMAAIGVIGRVSQSFSNAIVGLLQVGVVFGSDSETAMATYYPNDFTIGFNNIILPKRVQAEIRDNV